MAKKLNNSLNCFHHLRNVTRGIGYHELMLPDNYKKDYFIARKIPFMNISLSLFSCEGTGKETELGKNRTGNRNKKQNTTEQSLLLEYHICIYFYVLIVHRFSGCDIGSLQIWCINKQALVVEIYDPSNTATHNCSLHQF